MAYIDPRTKLDNHIGHDDDLKKPQSSSSTTFDQPGGDIEIPLNTRWTFWMDRTDSRGLSPEAYEQNLIKIFTVDSVQKFWQVYNNIPGVDDLGCNYSYHLMREEYRPIREDPIHQRGGAWRLKCHNEHTARIWMELIVAAIGEQLTDPAAPHELLGVSVSLRDREDMVQLWLSDSSKSASDRVIEKVHSVIDMNARSEMNGYEDRPKGPLFLAEFFKAHQNVSSNHGSHHHQHRGGSKNH